MGNDEVGRALAAFIESDESLVVGGMSNPKDGSGAVPNAGVETAEVDAEVTSGIGERAEPNVGEDFGGAAPSCGPNVSEDDEDDADDPLAAGAVSAWDELAEGLSSESVAFKEYLNFEGSLGAELLIPPKPGVAPLPVFGCIVKAGPNTDVPDPDGSMTSEGFVTLGTTPVISSSSISMTETFVFPEGAGLGLGCVFCFFGEGGSSSQSPVSSSSSSTTGAVMVAVVVEEPPKKEVLVVPLVRVGCGRR